MGISEKGSGRHVHSLTYPGVNVSGSSARRRSSRLSAAPDSSLSRSVAVVYSAAEKYTPPPHVALCCLTVLEGTLHRQANDELLTS